MLEPVYKTLGTKYNLHTKVPSNPGINRVHKSCRREYIYSIQYIWGWGENMNSYMDKHILF